MAAAGLSYEEALRVLRDLRELSEQQRLVVIGGQAVAIWYRHLAMLGYLSTPDEAAMTSKDIDFRASTQTVKRAATLLGGRARLPTLDDQTPSTGLVLFTAGGGRTQQIDFLDAPYGLRARDVVRTAQHIHLADGHGEVPVVVIHPQRLMESRVHNIVGLRQNNPHALRQARAAIACAAAFSRLVLNASDVPAAERVRAVLKLNERTYRFCRQAVARAFKRETGLDPFDAVISDDSGLPEMFRLTRYPQMQRSLKTLRAR